MGSRRKAVGGGQRAPCAGAGELGSTVGRKGENMLAPRWRPSTEIAETWASGELKFSATRPFLSLCIRNKMGYRFKNAKSLRFYLIEINKVSRNSEKPRRKNARSLSLSRCIRKERLLDEKWQNLSKFYPVHIKRVSVNSGSRGEKTRGEKMKVSLAKLLKANCAKCPKIGLSRC